MNLWIRMGDNSNYETFGDDFDAIVTYLTEYNLGKFIGWNVLYRGFVTENFSDKNYISIFWGDKVGNWLKSLSRPEREFIEESIFKYGPPQNV